MISTPINQGNSKPPCLCDHQLVTGLVLRVRSTIWNDKSEAWRFSVDEIVGKFKSRSWTKLEFAKNRPKSSLFFFKSCFLSLNVKFPRFLVQMSKWCYRSQCSWFCFLFVCLMRIGYILNLRKIGMVTMVPSTFQNTAICCWSRDKWTRTRTNVATGCWAKASEVESGAWCVRSSTTE